MTDNPLAPRRLRGAIVGIDPMNPIASIIVFQYNPDTLTRRVEARTTQSDQGDRAEMLRLQGPPREQITLTIEVDAADQPGGAVQATLGVYPPLAALEMLLYPKIAGTLLNVGLAAAGNIEVAPREAPLTLFVWGPSRVVPVRIDNLSITEESFDTALTPTRAKVDLTLKVLSTHDLKATHPGFGLFIAHQVIKEVLASSNVAGSLLELGASFKLF